MKETTISLFILHDCLNYIKNSINKITRYVYMQSQRLFLNFGFY